MEIPMTPEEERVIVTKLEKALDHANTALDKISDLTDGIEKLTDLLHDTNVTLASAVTKLENTEARVAKVESIQPGCEKRFRNLEEITSRMNGKLLGIGMAITVVASTISMALTLIHLL